MAKFKVVGLEAAFSELGELSQQSEGIGKMCVYDGAGVVADALKAKISGLPVRDPNQHGSQKKRVKGVTPAEKEALLTGMGIATMRTAGGSINTVIGFDGYFGEGTKGYPKGKPIPMIANAVNRGTSWLQATPFVNQAYNGSKAAAEAAMAARFDEEIAKHTK